MRTTAQPPLKILYEDNHQLVVLKEPFLLSQADRTKREDVLSLMKAYLIRRDQKPGKVWLALVQRLDYPVGGVLLLAKTSKAAARLSAQIRERRMERLYLAVVKGVTPVNDTLTHQLLKDRRRNITTSVEDSVPGARSAKLSYHRLACSDNESLLLVQLETGRSHQIRVQMKAAGFPLVGDRRYGGATEETEETALFAAAVAWNHVTLKEERRVIVFPEREFWRKWRAFKKESLAFMEARLDQGRHRWNV